MAQESKAAILVQEVTRRLTNTSEMEPQETRDLALNTFNLKMERSGYSGEERRDITRRGILRYEGQRQEACEGGRKLHRPANETKE